MNIIERRHVRGSFHSALRGAHVASEGRAHAQSRDARDATLDDANGVERVSRILHFGRDSFRGWLRKIRQTDPESIGLAANPERE